MKHETTEARTVKKGLKNGERSYKRRSRGEPSPTPVRPSEKTLFAAIATVHFPPPPPLAPRARPPTCHASGIHSPHNHPPSPPPLATFDRLRVHTRSRAHHRASEQHDRTPPCPTVATQEQKRKPVCEQHLAELIQHARRRTGPQKFKALMTEANASIPTEVSATPRATLYLIASNWPARECDLR